MVNEILNAITIQLGKTFGTKYHYYIENVEQGLVTPCFTVDMIEPRQRSRSPVLYDRTMPVVIHYFNDNRETIKKDCYAIAEQLMESLEHLRVGNIVIRGENLSWSIEDDVLQAFITYRFVTKRTTDPADLMETLTETKVSHT